MSKKSPLGTDRPWQQFENLVQKILEIKGFDIAVHLPRGDLGFDFTGSRDGERWAIEVKFYRTQRPQPLLIESAAIRVTNNGLLAGVTRGMLVVSCPLTSAIRAVLSEKFDITFVDIDDLRAWAAGEPAVAQSLEAIVASNAPVEGLVRPERTSVNFSGRVIARRSTPPEDTRGGELCSALKLVKRGRESWLEYERHCAAILRYLFSDDLVGWHEQRRTDDGLTRYDFVCRVRPTRDFWSFLIDHLGSRYVVFEFKNYSGMIKQGQILTTEKYLLQRGLRRVAIVFTRVGADKNATRMIQGAMREAGKLILVVNDDELCNMLHMKQRGEDPSDALFDLADDFLLGLPR